jgi:formyl-CoA transferase
MPPSPPKTFADFSAGPLTGLRVVEMGQLIAGPFCAQLMGDFGAEVIKIEDPGKGDPMRDWGQVKKNGRSLWWPVIARNKKSVTLDLRQAEAQAIARDLIAKSDVLIENFRPGTLEKWGLDYATLSHSNPGLVMIRVSGYGQTGPYAKRPGYGAMGEAMGGLRHVVGDPDRPPPRVGISIGDSLAATYACLGGVMALLVREKTGRGQVVDSALYEAVLAMMESLVSEYDQTGYVRERTGPILKGLAPASIYPTKDGQMVLISGNQDTVFKRLAEAMGRPELATDPRYATHDARGENQTELDDLIAAWSQTMDAEPLLALLDRHSVPNGKTYRAPDMMADAHFKAREAITRIAHPLFGDIAMQNVAPRLSETPGHIAACGPELGEHTAEVLKRILGFDDARLAQLKSAQLI